MLVDTPVVSQDVLDLIQHLYGFNYGISGDEHNHLFDTFKSILPGIQCKLYPSGSELNGWNIPQAWSPLKAQILTHDNQLILDCLSESLLGLSYLSPSFHGVISHSELMSRICTREDNPSAIPYDWTRLYRQDLRNQWGLCIKHDHLKLLDQDRYLIHISSSCAPSSMSVFEYSLPGISGEEYIFTAHSCHPFQANDDLSGVSLLTYFFSQIKDSNPFHTYTLLVCPEIIGPQFWLDSLSQERISNIKGVLQLKSVGNDSPSKMQQSFHGDSHIDLALKLSSLSVGSSLDIYPFREYYGNDEIVFESPPYNIPTVTLTNYPFPNYHTHLDTPKSLSSSALSRSYKFLLSTYSNLEINRRARLRISGLPCLSTFGLYKPAPAPGINQLGLEVTDKKWHLLMSCFNRHLSEGLTVLQLADLYNLPPSDIHSYLLDWENNNLLEVL